MIDVEDDASAEAAVAALAGPAISVVTITVTEKGYCLTPATGALDFDNPALRADLKGAFPPQTLLGLLALALERRRQAGGPPLTLISCDNVPSNGARFGAAMLEFAALRSTELTRWIEDSVTFPCIDGRPHRAGDDAGRRRGGLPRHRRARSGRGRRRAVPAMGDRGRVRRRAAAFRPRRGAVRPRREAVRARQDARPQRRPIDARASRRARRPRVHLSGRRRSGAFGPHAPDARARDLLHPAEGRGDGGRAATSTSRWPASATSPSVTDATRSAPTDRRRSSSVSSIRCASVSPLADPPAC